MSRTDRAPHTHITQAVDPAADCPACALIRPGVMPRAAFRLVRAGIFGPPLNPESPACFT